MKLYAFFFFFVIASSGSLWAQLCNGSLGDPVVHIDFGKGQGSGPSLNQGVTTYSYVSVECPDDGFYTLRNSMSNCFNGTWHTVSEDHTTGDVDGYFMLVNASFVPGDFYIDTVRGLCANTTYEFAAWIMNVLKPGGFCGNGIDPDLTFTIQTIDGTILASRNSGNITEGGTVLWSQYGVFFKTPVNITDVIVRITNNAPGGCGNDIGLDDITFRPCGPPVNAIISENGLDTAVFCEGNSSSLLLIADYAGGYLDPSFQWQESKDSGMTWKNINGAVNVTYLRPPTVGTGSYQYKMLVGETADFNSPTCRTASNIVAVNIYPFPVLNLPPVVTACENSDAVLEAKGASIYNWTGPNNNTFSSSSILFSPVKFNDAGVYYVIGTSDKGCSTPGSTNLTVYPSVTASVNADMTICEGSMTNLSASGGTQYRWIPATGLSNARIANPVVQPKDSTLYKVIVTNQYGCADTAQVAVNVWKKPIANAGPDKRTKPGMPVQLDGSASGFDVSYYWTPANLLINSSSLTPVGNPPQSTTYTLHVVSAVGCGTSTDNMELRVYEIPNAFSPNTDGINDTWVIKSAEAFADADIEIYNRYGQMVFRSRGYSKPWNGTYNGKPVPAGTYYYVVNLKSGNEPNITGWVFIVR